MNNYYELYSQLESYRIGGKYLETVLKLIKHFNDFNDGYYILINEPMMCNYKEEIVIMAQGIIQRHNYENRYEPVFLLVWDASEYNNYSAGYLDTNTALEVKEIGVFDLIEGRVI